MKLYYHKTRNGTFYKKNTKKEVVEVLENARENGIRITIDYGNTKTGKSWNEKHDILGYVGRSIGKIKIPLLIYNKRCLGGVGILDDCIIAIHTSKGKKKLYQIT